MKLPAEEMAAGLDEARSGVRARLITLTSVGAAVYLGYYIFPLVGAHARPPHHRPQPAQPLKIVPPDDVPSTRK